MASLPSAGVNPSRCLFEHCGVDFMGPLEVKQGRNLSCRYCPVFTYLVSKCTHLKRACYLTSSSFLMAMWRFLAVRGYVTKITNSNNGTNFTGASAELKRGLQRLDDHKITNQLAPCVIEWKHTPPLASHHGGIYKAIIRLVRKSIASLVADRHLKTLTDEGLLTLFKEIECVLSNRPLTQVGIELCDVEALLISMFLTGSV